MDILAHRGMWKQPEQRNSMNALVQAIRSGFGIETDVRDCAGNLVISHDIAGPESAHFEDFLKIYSDLRSTSPLAINIKADGLQTLLQGLISKYHITNYFLFDMSVPEQVVYSSQGFNVYTRKSDVEGACVMPEHSKGIWLDAFFAPEFMTVDQVRTCLAAGGRCCIVSPELHGNPYKDFWSSIRKNGLMHNGFVQLCTDLPEEARRFFYED